MNQDTICEFALDQGIKWQINQPKARYTSRLGKEWRKPNYQNNRLVDDVDRIGVDHQQSTAHRLD